MDADTLLPVITDRVSRVLREYLDEHNYSSITVLVDNNTHEFCYPIVADRLPEHTLIRIAAGEEHKHIGTCHDIWEQLTTVKADRRAVLINLGGGVIGDMGGFCAATFKRGVDFINLPTTLLAQVDASIGGKLGIDFGSFKNHIGLFKAPGKVIIDPVFLKTLPKRELMSGFAEVVKHALIVDRDHWQQIKDTPFEAQDISSLISRSVELKAKVVNNDPLESGLRKILNFGHTIGHAVEGYFLIDKKDEKVLHGEAVAAGMIMEAYLSVEKSMLDVEDLEDIQNFLARTYGKINIREVDVDRIASYTRHDKKNEENKILCTLLEEPGNARWDIEIKYEDVVAALKYYIDLDVVKI